MERDYGFDFMLYKYRVEEDETYKDKATEYEKTIARQVGQRPVMSFGNSAGDISMTNFVMGNKPYKTAAFFVCCDDEVRESGSAGTASQRKNVPERFGAGWRIV